MERGGWRIEREDRRWKANLQSPFSILHSPISMRRPWMLLLCLACLLVAAQPANSTDELHPTPWFTDFLGEQSTLGGQPLPVGAVVRAYDPTGVLAGRAEVALSGWYLMPVYGDDPLTEFDEGAESGDTITFTVDDYPAVPLGPDPPLWVGAGSRVHVELETCPLFGDLDCDCDVDIVDIMMVASRWSCQLGDECYDAHCDLDGDGDIDIVDCMQVAVHWGEVCSP